MTKRFVSAVLVSEAIVLVLLLISAVILNYRVRNALDLPLAEAKAATTITDALSCMKRYQQGMENLGITKGHRHLFTRGPHDDLSTLYNNIVLTNFELEGLQKSEAMAKPPTPQEGQAHQSLRYYLTQLQPNMFGAVLFAKYRPIVLSFSAIFVAVSIGLLVAGAAWFEDRRALIVTLSFWLALGGLFLL